MRRNDERVR